VRCQRPTCGSTTRWPPREPSTSPSSSPPRQRPVCGSPDTIITNDPDAAYARARNLARPVTCKPLSGVWHADEGQVRVIYTTPVTDIAALLDPAVARTAHLFQEQVSKAFEARAVVVGTKVLAVRIDAGSDTARLDWRSDCDALCAPSGEFVFLETNQAGEWGWLAGATGIPVAAALADLSGYAAGPRQGAGFCGGTAPRPGR
jgi:hypothetical protein